MKFLKFEKNFKSNIRTTLRTIYVQTKYKKFTYFRMSDKKYTIFFLNNPLRKSFWKCAHYEENLQVVFVSR